MTLARVLTLVIVADTDTEADEAIVAANDASRQHPCRIIALVGGDTSGASRLDAQIRVGGDAGAGEVVVLRLHGALAGHGDSVLIPLLLADSPVVAWWPKDAPQDAAGSTIGQMAQRRITDTARPATRGRRSGVARSATSRATPTWPGPASPCGVACWPRRWTSRHTSPWWQQSSSAQATPPPQTCWPGGWRIPSSVPSPVPPPQPAPV